MTKVAKNAEIRYCGKIDKMYLIHILKLQFHQ
jgi:hypothetical protein